jgi:hypothetical protein
LDAKLDRLNADEIYVGFDQIANLIGDGHTYVAFPPDHANLPLDIMRFGSGVRIDAVGPGYEGALGALIISIQDTSVSRAQELAATVTPVAETAGLRDLRVDGFLANGLMLHGLGITSNRDSATYVLAGDDGKSFTVEFKALAAGETPKWVHAAAPRLRSSNGLLRYSLQFNISAVEVKNQNLSRSIFGPEATFVV